MWVFARKREQHSMTTKNEYSLGRRLTAESIGTALLLAAVVGSGIMGERLAGGNTALALLANTVATGTAFLALILAFGAISGAHFNPAVTLPRLREAGCYGAKPRGISPIQP